ncbi:MAG: IS630 family transposase [Candidatus Brocadiaceae bacterium]
MAPDKKGALRTGRSIVFIDESGFMLQPLVRATWAPKGCTPVLKSWDRHDRISALSAVTVSPRRRRLGLYFSLQRANVKHGDVMRFLRSIRRHLGRRLIVVLDRLNAHRSAGRKLEEASPGVYQFEWLPSYAPDLNPVEGVWNQTKYADLANAIPDDIESLGADVHDSLNQTRSCRSLLKGFFRRAGLGLPVISQ